MAFCAKCGHSIPNESKFCLECGVSIINNEECKRNVNYDGKIHKCPNCGEILNSFVTNCPLCGYELRDTNVSSSIKAFAEKMEQLQQNGKRTDKDNIISHICTFPIPNTKEDLFEFIILAGANIRDDRYDDDLPKYKQEISDAWKSKFEQAYTKAKISFKNSPEFKEIESIYSSKITQQRKAKISAPIKTNLAIICSLLFTLLICGIILFGDYFIVSAENKRLESIVEEIYVHIEQEEYVLARSKAATLVFSGSTTTLGEQNSEKWDKTRTELLAIIDAALEGSGYEVQQPQENNKSEGGFWQGFFNGFDSGFK